MKKRLLALLCALSMILVSFTACGAPRNANALFKKVNKAMRKIDAIETETTINLEFQKEFLIVKGEAKGKTIQLSEKDDYYYYSTSTTKFQTNNSSVNIKDTVSLEAYHNGNYFMLNKGEGIDQKLYSTLTPKEARKYVSQKGMNLSLLTEDCQNSFTQNDDGTWTLEYSSYGQTKARKVVDEFGIDTSIFPDKITDMSVKITADSDYRIKDITINFVFTKTDKYNNDTMLTIRVDYLKFDGIERVTDGLDTEEFDKIEDIRLLTKFSELIEERLSGKNETFTLELNQKIRFNSQNTTIKEKDTVNYGINEDGYFYTIDSQVNNKKYSISYSDGSEITEQGTKSEEKKKSEADAKKSIEDLVNCVRYAPFAVSDIKKEEDGVYTVTCDNPNPESYTTTLASVGATYTTGQQTIKFTVKDNKLLSITSTSKVQGKASKLIIVYEIESTLNFE